MKRFVLDIEVQKPLEQDVEAQLLAELTLLADREEGHQHARLDQMLGRNRGSSVVCVHLVVWRRHAPQRRVREGLDLGQ